MVRKEEEPSFFTVMHPGLRVYIYIRSPGHDIEAQRVASV